MSNIVINGETYEGVESISANTPDGGTATYLSETLLETKQNKIDENLNTESKEIVGAINELKESVGNGVKEYLHHVTYECYYENQIGEDDFIMSFISSGEFVLRSNSATSLEESGELLKHDGYYFDYFYEEFEGDGLGEQMPGRGLIFGRLQLTELIIGKNTNNEKVEIWIGDDLKLTDIVTEITVV